MKMLRKGLKLRVRKLRFGYEGSCVEGLVPSWRIQSLRSDWTIRALIKSMDKS
jgi:hypothetical protein